MKNVLALVALLVVFSLMFPAEGPAENESVSEFSSREILD